METKCLQVFGERLKTLREERELSQRELAEVIGISKGAVYYYESDGRAPDIVTLEKLSDYFGVSADYLLGRTNARTQKLKLKSVCDKVGLSDKSVLMLARLKKKNNSRLRIINLLLEQADIDIDEFCDFLYEDKYSGSVLNAVCRFFECDDGRITTSSIPIAVYHQIIINQLIEALKEMQIPYGFSSELGIDDE